MYQKRRNETVNGEGKEHKLQVAGWKEGEVYENKRSKKHITM